jgi:hypothetical protein
MRRNVSARLLATLLVSLLGSAKADDGPPPLTPPATIPPAANEAPKAPAPLPAPAPTPPATRPENRPVLALPGVTAPTNRSPRPATSQVVPHLPPPSLAPGADGGLAPLEMPALRRPSAESPDPMPLPSERFRGRVIESTPASDNPLPPIELPPLTPPVGPRPGTSPPVSSIRRPGERIVIDEIDILDPKDMKGLDKDRDRDKDKNKNKDRDTPPQAPSRRPGLFGSRLNLNLFAPRGGMGGSDSEVRAEPRSDPAADAAIKRRVERQARDVVGDRAKGLDVKVVGRSITIQAHGVKILQRRAVRRSLEAMPGLSGYRSNVEIVD